jgi:hypothetical protein
MAEEDRFCAEVARQPLAEVPDALDFDGRIPFHAVEIMSTENSIISALETIESEMRKMLTSQEEPYAAGWNIWGIAMSNTSASPDIMHPLWLIWGALTDWVENKPQEKPEAEEKMRRAAREWLSLDLKDIKERTAYLDRWVYEEMGYERKDKT